MQHNINPMKQHVDSHPDGTKILDEIEKKSIKWDP